MSEPRAVVRVVVVVLVVVLVLSFLFRGTTFEFNIGSVNINST